MRTPKEYLRLIKSSVLTTRIIAEVIYSLNKRAKNWKYRNLERYKRAKKIRNWNLLDLYTENCEVINKYRALEYYKKKDFILITLFEPELIHIIDDVEYLYYKIHRSDFHLPVYVYELYGYCKIPEFRRVKVDNFHTFGANIEGLLSVQFCNMVIDIIKKNNFILIASNT